MQFIVMWVVKCRMKPWGCESCLLGRNIPYGSGGEKPKPPCPWEAGISWLCALCFHPLSILDAAFSQNTGSHHFVLTPSHRRLSSFPYSLPLRPGFPLPRTTKRASTPSSPYAGTSSKPRHHSQSSSQTKSHSSSVSWAEARIYRPNCCRRRLRCTAWSAEVVDGVGEWSTRYRSLSL